MTGWNIIDLPVSDEAVIHETADLLLHVFAEISPEWLDMDEAVKEVRESLAPGRISRIAVDEGGSVLGWVGGIEQYDGKAWELHPLAVRLDRQREGIGKALVRDLEQLVKKRGAITLWLGTDDETNLTSIGGIDLYPNVLERLMEIENLRGHPYEFYQRLGFEIVGVMPDANGFGKPDIYMAKRVGATRSVPPAF